MKVSNMLYSSLKLFNDTYLNRSNYPGQTLSQFKKIKDRTIFSHTSNLSDLLKEVNELNTHLLNHYAGIKLLDKTIKLPYYVSVRPRKTFFIISPLSIFTKLLNENTRLSLKFQGIDVSLDEDYDKSEYNTYHLLKYNFENILHLVSHIYFNKTNIKSKISRHKELNKIPLGFGYLKIHANYKEILWYLKERKILDIDIDDYACQKECRHGKINIEYKEPEALEKEEYIVYQIEKQGLIKYEIQKFKKFNKEKLNKKEPEELKTLSIQEGISFTQEGLKDIQDYFSERNSDEVSSLIMCDNFLDKFTYNTETGKYILKDIHYHRSPKVKRLYHVLTTVNERVRKNMMIGEDNTCEIDCRSSHAFIYGLLFDESFIEIPHIKGILSHKEYIAIKALINKYATEHFNLFRKIVSTGLFYEMIGKFLEIPRENVKKEMLVFFYNEKSATALDKKFNILSTLFPFLIELKEIFNHSYKENRFSVVIMEIESYVMIDKVFNSIISNGISCLPIHDSFLCKAKDEKKVKKIIKDTISNMVGTKFPPCFKQDLTKLHSLYNELIRFLYSQKMKHGKYVIAKSKVEKVLTKFFKKNGYIYKEIPNNIPLIDIYKKCKDKDMCHSDLLIIHNYFKLYESLKDGKIDTLYFSVFTEVFEINMFIEHYHYLDSKTLYKMFYEDRICDKKVISMFKNATFTEKVLKKNIRSYRNLIQKHVDLKNHEFQINRLCNKFSIV